VGLLRDRPLREALRRVPGRPLHPPLARRPVAPPGRPEPGAVAVLARVRSLCVGGAPWEGGVARDGGRAGVARGRAGPGHAARGGGGLLGLARHGGLGPPSGARHDPAAGTLRGRGPRAPPPDRSWRERWPCALFSTCRRSSSTRRRWRPTS
jgi:hypothetical protein